MSPVLLEDPQAKTAPAVETKPQYSLDTVPNMLSLRGKTIAITGGARGLGMAVAYAVVESGGHVACLDLLPAPSESEWAGLQKLCKPRNLTATYAKCDVTSEAEMEEVINAIEQNGIENGAPFYDMVACAGIQQKVPALDYNSQDFERILRVNVTGAFITAKWTARKLVEKRRPGSIVLIASMSGNIANRGLTCSAYNSSKSAVQQMCRSLAQEWGQYGIRINTLSPGYIRTDMTNQLLAAEPEVEKIWMAGALLGRLATPDEFKAPAIFLLSEGSSFMTGADLRVDGGHCASA
ncbi:oxidoreductase, short chain dehydrogenase/reductase family [Talaromyces stipitatus ATCC 10500]|uniref:Oxidoreductase, short chain dehydrogenase/reductase family n=1 Tax=Talaromyces stipitatus (strain ATCC 10500 / CBS 375.48 / QM 6759 / NRRL 1006) TaxID=441959 RepID=B8M9A6_TALSN|nr:oxidoreductase, short chain dehydrogenase/reductase family [Talaromyces stipitatus ATCC 10500]EED17666.1 oxidoreductase, short chain dehydrogenase/reductase family [Talaromyces stipitatus ATCC 10500]